MKFGQILVCCMRNFSNLFAQYWRLETDSRLFYFCIEMKIKQDLVILIVDIYHFLLSLIDLFKKMEHWNFDMTIYYEIEAGF